MYRFIVRDFSLLVFALTGIFRIFLFQDLHDLSLNKAICVLFLDLLRFSDCRSNMLCPLWYLVQVWYGSF